MSPLPDIPLGAWVEDQQKRFREATDPYFDAFEFSQAASETVQDIPSDWPLPGGEDQWKQAQQDRIEQELRLEQQREEEQQRQRQAEIEAQLRAEQQAAEQAATQQATAVGIPSPDMAAQSFQTAASRDDVTTTGAFDQTATMGDETMRSPLLPPERNIVPFNPETGDTAEVSHFTPQPQRQVYNPETQTASPPGPNQPLSDVDMFKEMSGGLMTDTFGLPADTRDVDAGPHEQLPVQGPPEPDHTSSAIWPDVAGNISRMGETASNLASQVVDVGTRALKGEYGIGRIAQEAGEKAELEREAVMSTSPREQIEGVIDPTWAEANPEKAQRLEELRTGQEGLVMGASGTMGGGGMLRDAADAIKQLMRTGMADDAILALERNLAERADVKLSTVQKMTRGSAPTIATAAEEAPAAEQPRLVGAQGEPLISAASVEEHIPGIGMYEDLGESGTSRLRQSRAAYEATDAARPMTREEIIAQGERLNPLEESEALLARERGQPAAQIEAVRTGAAGGFSAAEHAQQEVKAAENVVADLRRQYGDRQLSPEQQEEVAAAMLRVDQLTERAAQIETGAGRMAEASHRGAGELGRGLQQLRSPITGKRAGEQLERINSLFNMLGDAGEEALQSVKQGKLTPKAKEKLEGALRKIKDPKRTTDVTEDVADELERLEGAGAKERGTGNGGGKGKGEDETTPKTPEPREESLAERLGRLKREQGQLEESLAPPAARSMKAEEIDAVLTEMREAAIERAAKLAEKTNEPLTLEDAERAINESIGRRTQARIQREETERVNPLKSRLPQSLHDALGKQIDAGLAKYNKELDDLIAAVENRNATDAKRILDGVEKRNAALADQVVKGAFKRNDEAAAQFYGQVTGRNFAAREREARGVQKAAEAARLQEIERNIQFVLDHPDHPGAMDQLLTLGHDMTSVSQQGFERWDDLRKRLFKANITRAGMKIPDADYGTLISAFRNIDPDKPASVSEALKQAGGSSLWDVGREIQYVNMLSDVATNIRNLSANSTNAVIKLGFRNPIESFLGLVTPGANNTGGSIEGILGFASGVKGSLGTAGKIWLTGVNPRDVQQVIETGNIGRMRREVLTERFGPVGAFMHMVSTRPLEALDVLVGDAMRQSVISQEIERTANQLMHDQLPEFAGRDKAWLKQHIQENPWDFPQIVAKADQIRERTLLREDNRIANWVGQVQKKANSPDADFADKAWATVVNFGMPFSRVPVNFAKQGLDYALFPITDMTRFVQAARHGDKRGMVEATSHAAVGGAMLSISTILALNDSLTLDGPEEEGDRRIWLETHRPRSWRIPGSDTWISWENSPWAIPAAAVAGATEAYKAAQQKADQKGLTLNEALTRGVVGMGAGALKGISSNVFLDSVLQNIEMLTGQTPGPTSGASFGANMIARYVPLGGIIPSGLMGFLARAGDAVDRDAGRVQEMTPEAIAEGIGNRLQLRIPGHGLSAVGGVGGREDLPERKGAFGETVRNISEGIKALSPTRFGPGYAGYDENLIRKAGKLEDLSVGMPNAPTEITLNSRSKLPLTIAEQREFQQAWGQQYARILDKIEAKGGQYRADIYERARNRARDAAEKQLLRSIPREERKRRVLDVKSRQTQPVR